MVFQLSGSAGSTASVESFRLLVIDCAATPSAPRTFYRASLEIDELKYSVWGIFRDWDCQGWRQKYGGWRDT